MPQPSPSPLTMPQPFLLLPNCMNTSSVPQFQDFTEDEDALMPSTEFSQTEAVYIASPESKGCIIQNPVFDIIYPLLLYTILCLHIICFAYV